MRNSPPIHRRATHSLTVALAALATIALAAWPARAEIVEEIVARINDSIITRSELEGRRAGLARQMAERLQGEELERRLREAQDAVLFDMINEELLVQQAALTFDMDKYFEELKVNWKRANDVTTDAQLAELLKSEGVAPDDFRRLLLKGNVPQDILQFEVGRRLVVTPEEIEAYYKDHAADYGIKGEVQLREIVVLEANRGREAARALIDEARRRIDAGEAFADVARAVSESPSKERGGLIGPFNSGDLAPALEAQAFSLPPGTVGEPLATSFGFQMIQVESRADARLRPLSDVSEEIEKSLRQTKYTAQVEEYIKVLWAENIVVVNDRYATGKMAGGGPYATRREPLPSTAPAAASPNPDLPPVQPPAAPPPATPPPATPPPAPPTPPPPGGGR